MPLGAVPALIWLVSPRLLCCFQSQCALQGSVFACQSFDTLPRLAMRKKPASDKATAPAAARVHSIRESTREMLLDNSWRQKKKFDKRPLATPSLLSSGTVDKRETGHTGASIKLKSRSSRKTRLLQPSEQRGGPETLHRATIEDLGAVLVPLELGHSSNAVSDGSDALDSHSRCSEDGHSELDRVARNRLLSEPESDAEPLGIFRPQLVEQTEAVVIPTALANRVSESTLARHAKIRRKKCEQPVQASASVLRKGKAHPGSLPETQSAKRNMQKARLVAVKGKRPLRHIAMDSDRESDYESDAMPANLQAEITREVERDMQQTKNCLLEGGLIASGPSGPMANSSGLLTVGASCT